MKILWYELEDLRPTPSCSCVNPCTCSLSNYVHNYKNMEYIICFLKGLNANYSNVRTQILLMDPLPSISKVYSSVSQQGFNHSDDSTAVSINYTNPKNLSNQSKGRGYQSKTHIEASKNDSNSLASHHRGNSQQSRTHSVKQQNHDNNLSLSKEEYKYLINLLKSSHYESSSKKQST
ncbi:hypothetical protein MTR_5g007160 [Medicago truncatula]|uniref:Uncharacterized protein n=1 Tax=Medicago truncatula TaxID=3880 RepID=G7K540_MEDTR|nr:hypothetical protein MTR_5g007160 [Medicago truncatula]